MSSWGTRLQRSAEFMRSLGLAAAINAMLLTSLASAAQVTWTNQDDFETNASTTGTPTTRLKVDTASIPGSVRIASAEDILLNATIACTTPGDKVYTTGIDRTSLAVINATDNSLAAMIPLQARAAGVVYNSANNKLYVGQHNSNQVTVIDVATDTIVATIQVGNGAYAAAYNPIQNKVYIVNTGDQTVSVLDGTSNEEVVTPRLLMAPGAVTATFDPATNRVYLTNKANQYLTVIDGATNQVLKNVEIEAPVSLISGLRVDAQQMGIDSADAMYLSWDSDCLRASEQIQFQIRTADDLPSLANAIFHGPDGTAGSWYQTATNCTDSQVTTTVDLDIPYAAAADIQAKLSSDGLTTPVLHEVRLGYEAFPDLVVPEVSTSPSATVGSILPVSYTVANQGAGAAAQSRTGLYLFSVATGASHYLGEQTTSDLPAGASVSSVAQTTVPTVIPGEYLIKACADYHEEVTETDEGNNCTTGGSVTIQGVDLIVTSVSGTVNGGALNYSITVKNQGNLTTTKTFYVTVYVSTDTEITTADRFFNVNPTVTGGLAAGASKQLTGTIVLPVRLPVGDYYIGAVVDTHLAPTSSNLVAESDEDNNSLSSTTSQYIYNDLVVTSVTGSFSNGLLTYSTTIRNNGNGSMYATNYYLKLSTDLLIQDADPTVKSGQFLILNGGQDKVISGTTPVSGSLHGTFYLGTIVKPTDTAYEDNPSNNSLAGNQIVLP